MKKTIVYILVCIHLFFSGNFGVFFVGENTAFAATTTLSYAGTATDLGDTGYPWSNPSNATGDTTTTFAQSTVNTRNRNTNTLALTNFNLATAGLPTSAIINGIQAEIEWNTSNSRMRDTTVQLTKNGNSGVGNNYATNSNSSTIKSIDTYGGLTDLWGTTWSTSELTNPNFGILLQYRNTRNGSRDANIYRVRITIDYTEITTPGGVGGNLSLWLKANKGTSTTIDGANLNTWNDQSTNGVDATAVSAPIYRNNTSDNLNFYPVIDFDGSSQYMSNLNNGAHSDSYFMVIVPDNNIDGTISGNVPFGLDCLSGVLSSGTCGLSFAGLTLGAFTVAIPDEVVTHAIGSSTNWRSSETGVSSYSSGKPMLLGVNENASSNGTDIFEKGTKIDNVTQNTYQTIANADYSLGRSLDNANPFWYDGKIAEIINFDSRISDADRIKIESYLSFKYGITLKNGVQDYISSDNTTLLYSSSIAGIYNNDIFGIGRDDMQALAQPQAKSVNDDAVITLQAVGEGTNISPSFNDIEDMEFLSMANNNASNVWSNVNAPSGYVRLGREWKAQETGEVGVVNIDFDVANTSFDIPDPSLGTNYYFLYDTNNNNTLSDDTPILMTNTSGNTWRVAGIDIDHNREFTIASLASSNNIPTDIALSPTNTNENIAAGSIISTLSTSDIDLGDTHSYSLVSGLGDQNNSDFTIVGNNLQINQSPDFELQNSYSIRIQTDDGNGGQFQKSFIITINNLGEAVNSIIDFEDTGKYTVTSGTWNRTTNNPYEGSFSLESDNGGGANTQSCFEVTNTFSTVGTIDFFYNVSSQAGGDFLRFYIDNIEISSWSGNVPWSNYNKNDIPSGTHQYKWCYIKNGNTNSGTDNSFIDYITFSSSNPDTTSPIITSGNFNDNTILPGGNHNIIINYLDSESGIDSGSADLKLFKWNGTSWGSDIYATGINSSSIGSSTATYSTNNISFGKYRYEFTIFDNAGNSATRNTIFYIDQPEFIIGSGSVNIGEINSLSNNFEEELSVTVKTIGTSFRVLLNKNTALNNSGNIIPYHNGIIGFGIDKNNDGNIHNINNDEIIGEEGLNINTNGDLNTYTYSIKLGAIVNELQASGDYTGDIDLTINIDY